MKNFLSLLILISLLNSCTSDHVEDIFAIKSGFNNSFPGKSKNLIVYLGPEFSVKQDEDTLNFQVVYDKGNQFNHIINVLSGDTVFAGTVSRYKGLFYFSQAVNDSTYWICAVKIGKESIRGLNMEWLQMKAWDSQFDEEQDLSKNIQNDYARVLQYIDYNNDIIRLSPEKKVLRKFYESIIDSLPSLPIIKKSNSPFLSKSEEDQTEIEPLQTTRTNSVLIMNLYPNPVAKNLTVELINVGPYYYKIIDAKGNAVVNGIFEKQVNELGLSGLAKGEYLIRLYASDQSIVESRRFIKMNN